MKTLGVAALAWGVTGCVADVGDLRDIPDPPESPVGPLFAPRDAGPAPPPTPTSSAAPAPSPIQPVTPSSGIPELEGRGSLTLLHGVVDAPTLSFCILVEGEEEAVLSAQPMPAGGLAFGQALVLPMQDIIDPASSHVRAVAIATRSSGVEESCAELLPRFGHALPEAVRAVELPYRAPERRALDAGAPVPVSDAGAALPPGNVVTRHARASDAGPPDAGTSDAGTSDAGARDSGARDAGIEWPSLRTAELPQLLPGTFEDRSYLLVATGCLGAPGLADPNEQQICGPSFSRDRSSFAGIVVPLSRLVDFGKLGVQFVHASLGLPELTVRSNPADSEGTFFTVASSVVLGEIAPYSARRSLTVEDLGDPLDDVLLELSSSPSGAVFGSEPWPAALAPNGLTLEDGRAYTVVLIGPGVDANARSWWNPPLLTVVDNDPTDD